MSTALRCYRYVGPIDLGDERLRGRLFVGARFVCGQARRICIDAQQVCGCTGHIIVRPRPADFIPPSKSIPWCSISCPRCVPTWEVSQAAKHLPPWNGIWTKPDVRLACPACRSVLTTSWSGLNGIPHTDGYRIPMATGNTTRRRRGVSLVIWLLGRLFRRPLPRPSARPNARRPG